MNTPGALRNYEELKRELDAIMRERRKQNYLAHMREDGHAVDDPKEAA